MSHLSFHPAHPPAQVRSIEARVTGHDAHWLRLRWKIMGAALLIIPPFAGKGRADGLWQTTCFEIFLQQEGMARYTEFNLSPSELWNAYDFVAIREGMKERPLEGNPDCTMRLGNEMAIFDAAIPISGIPFLGSPCGSLRCGITAVIEEVGGRKSYWALGHGKDVPDFHDPACFTYRLEAPQAS